MHGEEVDGMDVLAVRAAAQRAIERARAGEGPTLLECLTYRFRGHSLADPDELRSEKEKEFWSKRDPIKKLAKQMIDGKFATEDELKTIEKYSKQNNSYAAVINFSHYQSKNQKLTEAIKVYEKFIKHTSKNLKKSNSPYYYHSIGSTITSTALAYAAVGGMTKKIATEDFYFLESLSKYRSVDKIEDILVFPSSRISDRVYLGTGYRMKQSHSGFDLNKLFFNDQIFILLKKWLELGTNCKNKHINFVLMEAKKFILIYQYF